jgi:subtilase family serine protease
MNQALRYFFAFVCLSFQTALASTQTNSPIQADRVVAPPDSRVSTRLQGHVPGWAVSANDRGAVPADTPLRLTFVLSRSPEVQARFAQLLADQQNPSSSSYHQWLTPQQVGERFGPTQHDMDALTNWLGSQGLTVEETSPSRVFVRVTGSASIVAGALATSFHTFSDNGRSRMSATVDPAIPAAFAPLVTSVSGLADTDIRPMHHGQAMPKTAPSVSGSTVDQPQFTNNGIHYVTPADFSVIFDLKPVYSSGYTGAGQRVAIIGRSRVASTDISEFESETGLASNLPNTIIPTTGSDPGATNDGDQAEATMDVERLLGTAPAVQADLVVSSSASGGIFTAAQYEVQTLLDPVMTISFGSCEFYAGASAVSLWDTLFSQAASEGISVFVSSGDSGAAGCDAHFVTPPVYQLLSINYLCASSFATCAGGTEFVEGANSQYWSTTNGTGLASAVSYIPEGAWNEPQSGPGTYVATSGGGGASIYVPKPAWQVGTGVPADNARDVPDVSFPGAMHDAYYGCYAAGGGDCGANRFYFSYGTSAAAPSLAAVTALLNQKTGGSQGNLNPLLYRLAASNPSAFHDATPDTINRTVCSIGTPSFCNNSTPSANSLTGGLAGYALTTGFDQATGLGSLDVANFLNAAAAVSKSTLAPTTLSVQGSASTISDTQTATFTAVLTSKIAGTPTGTVQFYTDGNAAGAPVAVAAWTAVSSALPFPAAGSYSISASYSGDGTYASAIAPGIPLTVTGLASLTTMTVSNTAIPVSTSETFSIAVTPGSGTGTPAGVVRVNVFSTNVNILLTVPLSNGTATTPAIAFPTVGTYTITASYHGDSVFSPSSVTGPGITVQRLPSVVQLSAFSGLIGVGGAVNYGIGLLSTAQSATIVPVATGQMQLFSNGVALGAPFSLSGGGPGGFLQTPYEFFSTAGTYSITATYAGDAYWAPSTTAFPLTVTVLSSPATYELEVGSKTLSFAAGTSANLNSDPITVSSGLGFVGTVSLTCSVTYNGGASGVVAPTCSIPTSTMMVTPSSALFTAVIINSTARSNSTAQGAERPSGWRAGWRGVAEVSVCGLLLWVTPVRRRGWRVLAMMVVFWVGITGLSGCGPHTDSGTTPPPGTTAGSYNVTITPSTTVSGVVVPPVTITLTIT